MAPAGYDPGTVDGEALNLPRSTPTGEVKGMSKVNIVSDSHVLGGVRLTHKGSNSPVQG